jgi:integrase
MKMGCIYRPTYRDRNGDKRYSSVWWVTFYSRGKSIFESTKTADWNEAKRYLKKREGEVANGVPIIKGQQSIRFKALADDVITDYKINNKRSLKDVQTRYDLHIIPVFGRQKASSITTPDIRAYINQRQSEEASNGSINRELTLIKRAFNLGAQAGRVASKPHIEMLKENNARKGFFEPDQFSSLYIYLPEHMKPVVTFAYITGWRRSEILSLQWHQVDFEGRCVRLYTSKNDEGRVFPFTADLEAVLKAQRQKADELKRKGVITPYVFHHNGGANRGKPIREFKRSWATACRKAGIPGRLFHDFRRTAIRNLERAGVPRSVAMKLTGHKTESVFRRYDIVSEGDLQIAVERLAAFNHLKTPLKVVSIGDGTQK